MRRIFAFIVTSLDGYYEGPNQEFDWPVVDDEFNEFSVEQLDEVDALMFGRVTYEGMAQYWTTPEAAQDDPEIAQRMNRLQKFVVSTTLSEATWANTRLISSNVADEIATLKATPGRDIAIFGSSRLTVSLLQLGLLDELRVMVHPIILGGGRSIFRSAQERVPLKLLTTRAFTSGNVLLSYAP